MSFDRPGLILYTTLATIGPSTGFVLSRHYGGGLDAVLVMQGSITLLTGLVISFFLGRDYDEYMEFKHNHDGAHEPTQAYRNEPRKILNLNTEGEYNQVTPLVKIDVWGIRIKRCCRTLINQRESGFKIDLREETWKAQFGGRENYVHFRDVIMCNAFAKQDARKNSPFVVVDWAEVLRGAEGRIKN
jgi:hypothetical protein